MSFALAAALLLAQDTPLEKILENMENRASGVRDLSFRVEATGGSNMHFGMPGKTEGTVTHVRGHGIRVKLRSSLPDIPGMPSMLRNGLGGDYVYTPEAYFIFQKLNYLREMNSPLTHLSSRISHDDLRESGQDAFFLPANIIMLSLRFVHEEPLVYYALEPKLFFGLENNLAVSGKREVEGRTCHVLTSSREAPDVSPTPQFQFVAGRKEFLIDAETLALLRMEWHLTVSSSLGGRRQKKEQGIITTTVTERKDAVGGFQLPTKVIWEFSNPARQGRQPEQTITHALEDLRVNSGLKPAEILTGSERADLHTDMIPAGASKYEARIRGNPDDAAAHFNLAFARGNPNDGIMMFDLGGRGKPEIDTVLITRSLERAHELRPEAESPVLNLLSAYELAGAKKKELAILERIEKGSLKGPRLASQAATRLNRLGEFARAGRMLDSLGMETPAGSPVTIERLVASFGLGDEKAFLALLAGETRRCNATAAKISLIQSLSTKIINLPQGAQARFAPEKAAAMYQRGLADSPEETAFLLGRASALARGEKPAEAATGLLEAAPKNKPLVRHALSLLDSGNPAELEVVMRGGVDPPPDLWKDLGPGLAERLSKALEAVEAGDLRVPYFSGRALLASGNKEAAWKRYAAALESCTAAAKDPESLDAAAALAFRLADEEGPEDWLERCVNVITTLQAEGASLPTQLLFSREKNPLSRMAVRYIEKREWLKLYKLASPAPHRSPHMSALIRLRYSNNLPKGEHLEACIRTIRDEVYRKKDKKAFLQFADFLTNVLNESSRVPEVLKRARSLAPDDPDLAERLAASYVQTGQHAKALPLYREFLPKQEGQKRIQTVFKLADALLKTESKAEAVKTLKGIDLAQLEQAHFATRLAGYCKRAEAWDLGIAACHRAYELGAKPHFFMGRFQEKKGDFYEAIRHYNRGIREKTPQEEEMEQMMTFMEVEEGNFMTPTMESTDPSKREPKSSKEAKERILKKLGPDYLLERFLKQNFEPLSEKEERDVKRAIEDLGSDVIDDREEASETLKGIGPKAAPLLAPLMNDDDTEIRSRIRQLMAAWAEPE